MMKRVSVVLLVVLLAVSGAFAAKKPNQVSAGSSGSLNLNQITYSVGSTVQMDYSYVGLPVGAKDYLILQTICWGQWNGYGYDTSTQFFQENTITYSSPDGSGSVTAVIPPDYQGSGSCSVSFYLIYTSGNGQYAKTLATSTFTVATQ